MNNIPNSQNEPTADPSTAASETSETGQTRSAQSHAIDSLRSAFHKGAEDARSAAERAIPKIQDAATDALYWTAYGVAFAAVFQWTLLKQAAPEPVKAGCRAGIDAGKVTAGKWLEKMKQRKQSASPAPSVDTPLTGESTQPSAG